MTSQEKKTLTLKSSDSQTQPKLIHDVKQLVQSYNERKEEISAERDARRKEHEARLADNRAKGSAALFEHLKTLIPEKVKTYAGYGKSEARLFEFTFSDELKFENCYAKDLLTKGTVVADLQAYLDAEHSEIGEDGTRESAFLVYFNMIGRQQHDRSQNKFGVFINWDRTSWEAIQKRLSQSSAVRSRQDGQAPRSRGRRPYRPRQDENGEVQKEGETSEVQEKRENVDSEGFRSRGPRPARTGRGGQRGGRGGQRERSDRNDRSERTDRTDRRSDQDRDQRPRRTYQPRTQRSNDSVPTSHAENAPSSD